jgi:hypothetical protein
MGHVFWVFCIPQAAPLFNRRTQNERQVEYLPIDPGTVGAPLARSVLQAASASSVAMPDTAGRHSEWSRPEQGNRRSPESTASTNGAPNPTLLSPQDCKWAQLRGPQGRQQTSGKGTSRQHAGDDCKHQRIAGGRAI